MNPTLYERIGGEDGIDRLVTHCLDELRSNPDCAELRALYSMGWERYEVRMKEFLSGWLGGPALYLERHGMPMLRESHRRIVIDTEAKAAWMRCMRSALAATVSDEALRLTLEGLFDNMAESLRNA